MATRKTITHEEIPMTREEEEEAEKAMRGVAATSATSR